MTEQSLGVRYTGWDSVEEEAMADKLERQIATCKQRIAVIQNLIAEQRAADLSTAEAERVLALEARFLKILEDMLAAADTDAKA
jgi:hypothetical protein